MMDIKDILKISETQSVEFILILSAKKPKEVHYIM